MERIFQNLRCWMRRLLLIWTRSSRISSSRRRSVPRNRKPKKSRFPRGRQIAFMICDYFWVIGAHDTVLDYADLFSVTLHDDNVQEFDTRWDEVLLSVSKDSIQWYLGKSVQVEDTWVFATEIRIDIVRDGDSSKDIGTQFSKKMMTMVKRSLTSDTGELKKEQWSRIARDWMTLKEEKVNATSGKRKASVRRETNAVSDMRATIVHKKPTPKATPSEPSMTRGRSVSRKRSVRGKNDPGMILRQPCRYYLKGTCTRSLCEYWHPPECHFYKNETGCKAGESVCFRITRLMSNQIKKAKKSYFPKRRESDDKNAVAIVKSVSQLGSVSQDSDALVFSR